MGNNWFSITGVAIGNSDPAHYMYFDDVRLFRPCDDALECSPTHGQICPSIAAMLPPNDLLKVSNIGNASDMHLRVTTILGQVLYDSTFHNANGLPDFRLPRSIFPPTTATANYPFSLQISNACGAVRNEGSVLRIADTALYNPSLPWSDPTANWTGVPIPCCLNALYLQNMQIVGDVSFIVRDQIIVNGGVTLAPNSHVIFQAGNVIELVSAEFDGTNSSLEILEVPCPNRMACGNGGGCGGGQWSWIKTDSWFPRKSQLPPTAKA